MDVGSAWSAEATSAPPAGASTCSPPVGNVIGDTSDVPTRCPAWPPAPWFGAYPTYGGKAGPLDAAKGWPGWGNTVPQGVTGWYGAPTAAAHWWPGWGSGQTWQRPPGESSPAQAWQMPPGTSTPGVMPPPGHMPSTTPGHMPPTPPPPPGVMTPGPLPPGVMTPGPLPPGPSPGPLPPGVMPPGVMPPGVMPPGVMPCGSSFGTSPTVPQRSSAATPSMLPHRTPPPPPAAPLHGPQHPPGVWERPRSRSRSRSSRGEKYNSLVKKMKRHLLDKALEASISTAHEILDMGNKKPPIELLRSLLELSAAKPGATVFAKALQCCALGKIELEPIEYARLLGKLMSRNASLAQCRVVLNMALPPGSKSIPLVPDKSTDEEKEDAFKDGEGQPAAATEPSGADEEVEQEDEDQDLSDEELEFDRPYEVLELHDCIGIPQLNGTYTKEPAMPDVLQHDRPIYVKAREDADVGTEFETIFAYFCPFPYTPWRMGWYINSDIPEGKVFAYHPAETLLPPRRGWQVLVDGHRREDTAVFRVAGVNTAAKEAKDEGGDADGARQALSKVRLSELMGVVFQKSKPEVSAYFSHFAVLLHLERLEELSRFRRRLLKAPLDRLVKGGWSLEGLQVCGVFGKRGKKKAALEGWADTGSEFVAFWMPKWTDLERLRIKKGETVVLSETDPLRDRVGEGTVESVKWDKIVINLAGTLPDGGRKQTWRMDAYANKIVYERQFNALLKIAKMEKLDSLCEMLVFSEVGNVDNWAKQWSKKEILPPWRSKPKIERRENDERDVERSRVIETRGDTDATRDKDRKSESSNGADQKNGTGSTAKPSRPARLAQLDPRSPDGSSEAASRRAKVEEEVAKLTNINGSQMSAIKEGLIRRCTIIQGPPGTGKTHVAVNLLKMWTKTLGLKPLLATSDSNIAVDNIAEGLSRAGVSVVRLGRPEKVREHLEEIALDNILWRRKEEKVAAREALEAEKKREAQAPDQAESDAEAGDDNKAEEKPDEAKSTEKAQEKDNAVEKEPDKGEDAAMQSEHSKRQKERQEDFVERKRILKEADVICCTTISAGGDILRDFKFQGILVDEVAQATETSVIVPIVLRGTTQLVLCGDQCQLPPTVQSREAELRGLSLSLYARLTNSGVDEHFLDTQYRSHPRLAEFSSRCFYRGALQNGVLSSERPLPIGVDWPNPEVPVAFFEVGAEETLDGESKANTEEAECVTRLVLQVLEDGSLLPEEIGVVTPYMAQVRALRRAIRERVPEKTKKLIEIASVDNFQGREKELIIFSAVRSNPRGIVGFLGDWRRLNVMITRARRGLVVFGAAATLRHDCYWQQWLEWCNDLGGMGKARAPSPKVSKRKARQRQRNNARAARAPWDKEYRDEEIENIAKVMAGPKPPPSAPPPSLRLAQERTATSKRKPKPSAKPSARPSTRPSIQRSMKLKPEPKDPWDLLVDDRPAPNMEPDDIEPDDTEPEEMGPEDTEPEPDSPAPWDLLVDDRPSPNMEPKRKSTNPWDLLTEDMSDAIMSEPSVDDHCSPSPPPAARRVFRPSLKRASNDSPSPMDEDDFETETDRTSVPRRSTVYMTASAKTKPRPPGQGLMDDTRRPAKAQSRLFKPPTAKAKATAPSKSKPTAPSKSKPTAPSRSIGNVPWRSKDTTAGKSAPKRPFARGSIARSFR